jgi:hypothetical protein
MKIGFRAFKLMLATQQSLVILQNGIEDFVLIDKLETAAVF